MSVTPTWLMSVDIIVAWTTQWKDKKIKVLSATLWLSSAVEVNWPKCHSASPALTSNFPPSLAAPVTTLVSLLLQLIKAIVLAERSFIFSPSSLRHDDIYRHESGRCCSLYHFASPGFPFILINIWQIHHFSARDPWRVWYWAPLWPRFTIVLSTLNATCWHWKPIFNTITIVLLGRASLHYSHILNWEWAKHRPKQLSSGKQIT